MMYAVVCPKVYKGGIYLRYLTTDRNKAEEWAEQQTLARKDVRALDEKDNSHNIIYYVVELPFETDMEWTISQYHFEPFEEIEEVINERKKENRITAMRELSEILEQKHGPIPQEVKDEIESLWDQDVSTIGVN